MKLVSVDRTLKEQQNDILFSSKLFSTSTITSKIDSLLHKYQYFKRLYLYLRQYKAQPNDILCSTFKVLSTDIIFIQNCSLLSEVIDPHYLLFKLASWP